MGKHVQEDINGDVTTGGLINGVDVSDIADRLVPVISSKLDIPPEYAVLPNTRFGDVVAMDSTSIFVSQSSYDNGSGAVHRFNKATLAVEGRLDNPAATDRDGDLYGSSLYIDSTHRYTGARSAGEEFDPTSVGKVYVTDNSNNLVKTIDNPNPDATGVNDLFGLSIAGNDDYIAISARNEESPGGSSNSGYVYIYDKATWTLQHSLSNPNDSGTEDNDRFGQVTVLTEDFLFSGARFEDNATDTNTGVVYIYDTSTFTLQETLRPNLTYGGTAGFGVSVYADATHVYIGAPTEIHTNLDPNIGKVYKYELSTWINSGEINNHTGGSISYGAQVSVNNEYLFVSATGADIVASNSGVIFVYDKATLSLVTEVQAPIIQENLFFGANLVVDDNELYVGMPNYSDIEASQGRLVKCDLTNNLTNTVLGNDFNKPNGVSVLDNDGNVVGRVDGGSVDNIYKALNKPDGSPNNNTFLGYEAGYTTDAYGGDNVYIGARSGYLPSGDTFANVGIGGSSLRLAGVDFDEVVAVGASAGYYNGDISGGLSFRTTMIGAQSGYNNQGAYNTYLGYASGNFQVVNGDNNVMIGNRATVPDLNADDQLCIGGLIYGTGLTNDGSVSPGNVGFGVQTPLAKADIDGNIKLKTESITTSSTVDLTASTTFADATAGDIVLTVPTAIANAGIDLNIIRTDGSVNSLTISASGAELISGETSFTINQYDSVTLISNNQNWFVK